VIWSQIYQRVFFALGCALVLVLGLPTLAFAQDSGLLDGETVQTNPKNRPVIVSASVASQNAPPYPVLIAPANNAILTSGVVVFEWEMPTGHTAALDRFELYLNGTLKFGNIDTEAQETDDYKLTVTEGNKYRLELKQDKWLPDGQYTWKIRVVDVNDRGSDSSTWSFLIDSTPPNILITEIDGKTTAVSAADPTTIPTDPIIVTRPGPVIKGHTEAGSNVVLTVTFPDGSTQQYQTSADGNGYFSFTLGGLPANKVVTLTFRATDLAGLTRTLDGLKLMYEPRKIIITLPPIFPQPVTLTIFVWQPGFDIPRTIVSALKDLPPPFGPLVVQVLEPELTAPTKLIEVPVFAVGPYAFAWLLLIFGYVLAVFMLTRNALSYFFTYLMSFMQFWIIGSRGQYRWLSGGGLLPLPFFGFTLSWLDEKEKLHTEHHVATPLGTWQVPFVEGRLLSVRSEHTLYPFPPSRVAVREMTDGIVLTSNALALREGKPAERTEAGLGVTSKEKVVAVTSPIQRSGWPSILSFLPRLILLLMLILVLWVIWHAKTFLTIFLLIFTLWIFARDLQIGLRKRLEVYVS
jgi:hypothetical protein